MRPAALLAAAAALAALLLVAATATPARAVSLKMGRAPTRVVPPHLARPRRTIPLALLSGTVPLHGGILELGEFYVVVELGGQNFTVQVDTGSSTLAVPFQGCLNCTDNRFQTTPNTEQVPCGDAYCGFEVSYLDGSYMKGGFVNDSMSLGDGLEVETGIFGVMTSCSKGFETRVDGILGAAMRSIDCFNEGASAGGYQCFPTILDTLVAQGMPDKFGMRLDADGGQWDLGELDASYSEDDYDWSAMDMSQGFYQVATAKFSVGDCDVPSKAVLTIDSGTTLAGFPPAVVQYVQDVAVRNSAPSHEVIFGGKYCVQLTDRQKLDGYPSLNYEVERQGGGMFTVSLGPLQYLIDVPQPNGGSCTMFALEAVTQGDEHLLGDIFMQQFYTAFDRENSRIGFATLNNASASSKAKASGATGCPAYTGHHGGSDSDGGTTALIAGIAGFAALVALVALIVVRRRKQQAARATQALLAQQQYAGGAAAPPPAGMYSQM